MKYANRHIRVFISSVFKGMENEREFFRLKLLPAAQRLCKKYGVTLTFIDLRWGITEEENREQMVLHRCLEEIDKSAQSPFFFVGLVGNRYGTTFQRAQVESYLKSPDAKYAQWIQAKLPDQPVGVTDLEFLYAEDLHRRNPELRPLYYIREDSYGSDKDKLLSRQLDRIAALTDCIAIDGYLSLEEIYDHFLGELKDLLEEHFLIEETFDQYQRDKLSVLNEVSVEGVKTEAYEQTLSSFSAARATVSHPLFLQGQAGSGKTFLLSQLYLEHKRHGDNEAVLCLGNFEDPIALALKEISSLGEEELYRLSFSEKIDYLKKCLESYSGNLSVFIDAVDSNSVLFDSTVPNHDVLLKMLRAIRLPEEVSVIVSYQAKCTFVPDISVNPLTDYDLANLILSFGNRYGKTIPSSVLATFNEIPVLRLPMAASLIFTQLVNTTDSAEVQNVMNRSKQTQIGGGKEALESRWDDLVGEFIGFIVQDYPKINAKELSEVIPALLNDHINTDGISIDNLALKSGIPEVVVLEIIERLRPMLYIVDDKFRSRRSFHTGLNESKLERRMRLARTHFKNQDPDFLPLLLKNIDTYFCWVMGGRTKVEQWIGEYEEVMTSPEWVLNSISGGFLNFNLFLSYIRYINPGYYLTLCNNVLLENENLGDSVKELVRNSFFILEYPLFSLTIARQVMPDGLENFKEIYKFSLSYQRFLLHRREMLSSNFGQNNLLISSRRIEGSSVENFLNFKGFGELVYDTHLYKVALAEGCLRFSDFGQNVLEKIESKNNVGYVYGKLYSITNRMLEKEVLKNQEHLFEEVFSESSSIECSDVYTRDHLKRFLCVT